jgi:hypothetical protein
MELISEHSEVAGYKTNVQKSVVYIPTSNKQFEFDI